MDKSIRETQLKLLKVFSKNSRTFALSGGTALELFYLDHRFSRDLDFFSPKYNPSEIDQLIDKFNGSSERPMKMEDELIADDRARLRFYTAEIKGSGAPLKIDFVEDVFFKSPVIRKIKGIPVYAVNNIYYQKIMAIVGAEIKIDVIGREMITGRKEARDIVDIYYLSKLVCPLHEFMRKLSGVYRRRLVYWYRTYSRHDLKIGALDLDIYDKKFDAGAVIAHFDEEIKKAISGVLGEGDEY